jgi:hypothetical protein
MRDKCRYKSRLFNLTLIRNVTPTFKTKLPHIPGHVRISVITPVKTLIFIVIYVVSIPQNFENILRHQIILWPVPMAKRLCGRLPAEIVGSESPQWHGCLSVFIVVCCQVEVSARSWSPVQRGPTDCGASCCVIKKPREWGGSGPLRAVAPKTNKWTNNFLGLLAE